MNTTLLTGIFALMILLLSPLVASQSLSITTPTIIDQGENGILTYSLFTPAPYDGTIDFVYDKVSSSTTQLSFTSGEFEGTHLNGSFTITADTAGTYSVDANASNSSGVTQATSSVIGEVNSSAPIIVTSGPSGIVDGNDASLVVTTNEDSTCKFDITDLSYLNMGFTFTTTGTTNHNHTITGLSEGDHSYYVRCKDDSGYEMDESQLIDFTIDLPPTASISLSDDTPVKEGTIEITLTISENLDSPPTLSYVLDEEASKNIPLSGSGSTWNGFIIIKKGDDAKIGSFRFSGEDSSGNIGTVITGGNIFVVDTTAPIAPVNLKSKVKTNGDVELEWYYTGEEVDHYKVYRSTSADVSFVDFYKEAGSSESFLDAETVNQATYYYKVSAVDQAGNEGPLSDEVYATSVQNTQEVVVTQETIQEQLQEPEEEVPKVLPPHLVPRITARTNEAESVLLDIDAAKDRLNAETDQAKKEIISELGILGSLESAHKRLEEIINEANELKLRYSSDAELDKKLEGFDRELQRLRTTTPNDVSILEQSEFDQTLSDDDIEIAVIELLENTELTEKERKEYTKLNEKIKDDFPIQVSAKIIQYEHLDGSTDDYSFISKKISYSESKKLEDVVVMEFIPKSIAEHVDDITFIDKDFEVVEEDPIVKFGFLNFNYQGETISYTLNKKINIEDVNNAKSVVLVSFNELAKSSITGFSILPSFAGTSSTLLKLGLLIIVLLSLYYYFMVKDGVQQTREFIAQFSKQHSPTQVPSQPVQSPSSNVNLGSDDAQRMLAQLSQHIGQAKNEMVDKVFPVMMDVHQQVQQRQQHIHNNEVLRHLINQAHRYADAQDIASAQTLYKQVQAAYPLLSSEARKDMYKECLALHRKIEK